MQDNKKKEVRNLKGCLFSAIVDHIPKNTHLMGCNNTKSLDPKKARER